MSRDLFTILGLTAGRHEPAVVARQFADRRKELIRQLGDTDHHAEIRRELDDVYRAFATLHDPQRQAEYLASCKPDANEDAYARLRRLIATALEEGLLRYSRRAEILAEGRRLGISEFTTQLLIAQVQFGEEFPPPSKMPALKPERVSTAAGGARLAAAGILALAMFLSVIRWLGA